MDTCVKSFVNIKNARVKEQRQVMEMIEKGRYCPFCPEHYSEAKLRPVIRQGKYWHIRENRWPYKNTRLHLILIHNSHVERLSEITPEAAKELFSLLEWIEDEYQILSGAIGLRFGDIHKNGATVLHIHTHIVVADLIDRDNPNYLPVRFRMG